jgi:Reverse transcriptase (RNA-dependent DNA polymerase).
MTCGDSQAKAVIQNNMRESFRVNVGVRQGDALSVILFNLLLNYII